MTETEREALLERAGIMEYEGGLDRKAATLTAFALYFPADYQAMKEAAAHEPDADGLIFDYLEELIKTGPQSAGEGPPMKARQGAEALVYITDHNVSLIGAYNSGATIASGESWAAAFTTDPREITALMEGKGNREGRGKGNPIERFYFIPADAGLLCLDIDRKNGKDGIEEFYSWAERVGKPRHLLPRFLQSLPDNFPCYVQTPSSGLHLYFSYSGGKVQKKPLSPETPGVEIKHGAPGLTSPGSYKNGSPYILYGELENAPPLPAFILTAIKPPKPQAAAYIPHTQTKKEWGKPAWDKIREWTETDGAGAGRNDRAFHLARHARDHGYTETETLDAMRGEPGLDGLPEKEIETTVHSAFNKGRKSA